jgi:GNAT superfamily N-acetyltransferase
MGFNPRDTITWDGLHMCAMTAWMGERLIGAIPLEPRHLRVSKNDVLRSVHETVVAVDPQFRGSGIGSRLQEAIAQQRPGGARIVTVFREEPSSLAYRWYLKNGFFKAVQIVSWMCEQPASIADERAPQIWRAADAPWDEIETARSEGLIGAVERKSQPLRAWLAVHPYRQKYAFHVVSDGGGAFALLGVGTMHSQTLRAEVLEFIAKDAESARSLLGAVAAAAVRENWKPIRFPLAINDPNAGVAQSLGFTSGWTFDMLVRPLDPDVTLTGSVQGNVRFEEWRYAGIDYI